jgi:hypothetical protein
MALNGTGQGGISVELLCSYESFCLREHSFCDRIIDENKKIFIYSCRTVDGVQNLYLKNK